MAKTAKSKKKPWEVQGISRSKFFRDKRIAKAKRLAQAAAKPDFVPLHQRAAAARAAKKMMVFRHTPSAASLSEAALPAAAQAGQWALAEPQAQPKTQHDVDKAVACNLIDCARVALRSALNHSYGYEDGALTITLPVGAVRALLDAAITVR